MKTISADYNASTEIGNVRLTLPCSRDDLQRSGLRPGDWAWLSDGEVIVGASLFDEPHHGLVGIPDWETIVHLDDEGADDIGSVWMELAPLLELATFSFEDELRIFQLLTIMETIAPAEASPFPGPLSLRKAMALARLHRPALAIAEIDRARGDGVELFPRFLPLYLATLQLVDLSRAKSEALAFAATELPSAQLLAACIDVWAADLYRGDDNSYMEIASRLIDLGDRFHKAPGREEVYANQLARVLFHRGIALLRLGQLQEAKLTLELAHQVDPSEPAFDEARRLDAFGPTAQAIANRIRDRPAA